MNFLEKDLSNIIFEIDNSILNQRGLSINGIKKRELIIGNYGRADIVTFERYDKYDRINKENDACITIYELKQNEINWNTFHQIIRYYKGIKQYTIERGFNYDFKVVMIGKEISKDTDFIYLTDLFENIDIYTYEYKVDGLYFKQHFDYSLINKGWNIE